MYGVICECDNADCAQELNLSFREYEDLIRQYPEGFIVIQEHVTADEDVALMHPNNGWAVVIPRKIPA